VAADEEHSKMINKNARSNPGRVAGALEGGATAHPIRSCLFSKKAQLGKIITGFPVLILIVLVMGVFIAFSTYISIKNPIELDKVSQVTLTTNNLLLQSITIQMEGEEKEMLIFDIIKSVPKEKIHEGLKPTLTEENDCYLFFERFDIIKGYRFDTIGQIIPIIEDDKYPTKKRKYKSGDTEKEIWYYFGPCPEVPSE